MVAVNVSECVEAVVSCKPETCYEPEDKSLATTLVAVDAREWDAAVKCAHAVRGLVIACESMLRTTGGSGNWNGDTHESLKLIESALKVSGTVEMGTAGTPLKQLEKIVCVAGEDRGVVLMDGEGRTRWSDEHQCEVFENAYFSPLGEALISLHLSLLSQDELLARLERVLSVPAAEFVPAIADALSLIHRIRQGIWAEA